MNRAPQHQPQRHHLRDSLGLALGVAGALFFTLTRP